MSNPNSFRMNWREGDKALKEKPHIKLVLNAMKSNFNPALKDLAESTEVDKSDPIAGKINASDSAYDGKSCKKISGSTNTVAIESVLDSKGNTKVDHNGSKVSISEIAVDNKNTAKKNLFIGKNNALENVSYQNKKDSPSNKNINCETSVEKKHISKKDLPNCKGMVKSNDSATIQKPEVNRRRTEKKPETTGVDSGDVNCKSSSGGQRSSTISASNIKDERREIRLPVTDKSVLIPDMILTDKDNSTEQTDSEERKKRIARKRALRNQSVSHSEGAEVDNEVAGRKRSARRWSKEGESVLQNAIARKEKSLSSIGKSDDDKALKLATVRSLRDIKHSSPNHKKSKSPNTHSESTSDLKAKSPILLKSSVDSSNDGLKEDAEVENSETRSEVSSKASSSKHETESTYTKTGKRRYKPFRGLRYSFGGVSKRSKVIRRSAPPPRNINKNYHFSERSPTLSPKASTLSSLPKLVNGSPNDKCRSSSPAVADACTSKTRKSRREDPLSPSPSPGDTPADANQPESTAISFGAGTAGLCLCQSNTNLYIRKDIAVENDVSLMCQAVDSLEGRLIGCCNAVCDADSARLYRPSPRVPYVVLCEQHRQRLLRHHCCPGCGNYCTQGRFVQCQALHYYHRDCQLMIAGKPQCPHCGLESPPDEVSISLGVLKYPVFLPHQKLMKQTPSARMSLGSTMLTPEEPQTPPVGVAMTLPIATSMLDKGEREKLEKLINGACSVRSEGRSAHLPRYSPKHLYQAAKAGDPEKIIGIIRHGINPNHVFREINMRTALHAAAVKGHVLAVHVLVQAGAQLDPQDSDLLTPAMLAAFHGHVRIVQYLVKAGACVTHQGSDGMTALHIAAKRGDLETCHCLLSNSKAPLGYIDVKDDGGWTALVWSCEFRHSEVARYLLEKRADPLIRDNEENIALHWAAFSGSEEISEGLLNYGCNINCLNIHGDTPLHVAARQDKLQCVLLFLSRGAKPDVVNKLGQQALDCALEGGDCYNAINTTAELRKMTSSAKERTIRILSNDVTRGKEECEIQCLNAIDEDSEPRDYVYVTENCFTSNIHVDRTITSLQACECEDICIGASCKCTQLSLQSWYDSEGKLLPEFNFFDPPMLFECNEMCSCNVKLCRNRVVQRGFKVRFQLFRTVGKGWGVRTLTLVPKGTYVCEYIGEIISDCEADQREDDSYLFDLDNRDGETYCIDACRYGNIARFINHMCAPNLQPVRVFMGHHDLHFPRIAFFANRDIQPQEELGFDYGDKFWIIKYKSFTCTCGAPNCKYSETTIKQTLAEYNKKQEEETAL